MKSKIKIYCWACDYVDNHGEGLLARKFVKLIKKNLNYNVIILSPINYKSNKINFSFVYKYFSPILGLFILWYYYLRGNKVCYLNFLPLWNTFLFLFLPPSTILGPLTGFFYKGRVRGIEDFLRKNIIPKLFKFNYFILSLRVKKILFSTANLKEMFSYHRNHFYNFCLYDFKQNKNYVQKKIDFLIYYRKYSTKENTFIINLVNKLLKKNFIIKIVGHYMNTVNLNKNINLGFLNRRSLSNKLKQSKYTILSGENVFSFFALDALKENVVIFHNKKNVFSVYKKNLKQNFIPLDYDNLSMSQIRINRELKKKRNFRVKTKFLKLKNFNKYFD